MPGIGGTFGHIFYFPHRTLNNNFSITIILFPHGRQNNFCTAAAQSLNLGMVMSIVILMNLVARGKGVTPLPRAYYLLALYLSLSLTETATFFCCTMYLHSILCTTVHLLNECSVNKGKPQMGDIQAIEPYCIPSLRFFCDKGNFLRESIKLKYPEFGFSGLEYINLDNQGNIPYAKNKKKSYNYNFVKFCA